MLHDEAFHRLHDRFIVLNNNTPLTDNRASSKKMKRQTKMISIIKNFLVIKRNLRLLISYQCCILDYTKKRFIFLTMVTRMFVKSFLGNKMNSDQNWDKFYLENITKWWKKKAQRDTTNSRKKVGSEPKLNSGQMMMTFKLLDNGTQRLINSINQILKRI